MFIYDYSEKTGNPTTKLNRGYGEERIKKRKMKNVKDGGVEIEK